MRVRARPKPNYYSLQDYYRSRNYHCTPKTHVTNPGALTTEPPPPPLPPPPQEKRKNTVMFANNSLFLNDGWGRAQLGGTPKSSLNVRWG